MTLSFFQHTGAAVVGRILDANVNLVFTGDEGRLVVADIAVNAPNIAGAIRSSFRRFRLVLDELKRLVLVGDWSVILDPKMEKAERGAIASDRCENSLINLLAEHDLADKFRLDHPEREMQTWRNNSLSGQIRTYLDRVLREPTLNSFLVPCSTR